MTVTAERPGAQAPASAPQRGRRAAAPAPRYAKRRLHHVFAPDGKALVVAMDGARNGPADGPARPPGGGAGGGGRGGGRHPHHVRHGPGDGGRPPRAGADPGPGQRRRHRRLRRAARPPPGRGRGGAEGLPRQPHRDQAGRPAPAGGAVRRLGDAPPGRAHPRLLPGHRGPHHRERRPRRADRVRVRGGRPQGALRAPPGGVRPAGDRRVLRPRALPRGAGQGRPHGGPAGLLRGHAGRGQRDRLRAQHRHQPPPRPDVRRPGRDHPRGGRRGHAAAPGPPL